MPEARPKDKEVDRRVAGEDALSEPGRQSPVVGDGINTPSELNGPDLTQGVELSSVPDGTMLLGHARGEPVHLVRRGEDLFAIGATCTHYGAPLAEGLVVGDTIR